MRATISSGSATWLSADPSELTEARDTDGLLMLAIMVVVVVVVGATPDAGLLADDNVIELWCWRCSINPTTATPSKAVAEAIDLGSPGSSDRRRLCNRRKQRPLAHTTRTLPDFHQHTYHTIIVGLIFSEFH